MQTAITAHKLFVIIISKAAVHQMALVNSYTWVHCTWETASCIAYQQQPCMGSWCYPHGQWNFIHVHNT